MSFQITYSKENFYKILNFKIFFSGWFALCLHLHIYIYRVRDQVASSVLNNVCVLGLFALFQPNKSIKTVFSKFFLGHSEKSKQNGPRPMLLGILR